MSSVSHIRYSPPEGVQMVETEEIRFKIGDACCSIADQGYDVRDCLAHRHDMPILAAGTQNERVGDGPSVHGQPTAGDGRCHGKSTRSRAMLPARQTAPGLGGRMNRVPDLSWLGARCTLCRGRESFI